VTRLADCARPDSTPSRLFADAVDRFLFGKAGFDPALAGKLVQQLKTWNGLGQEIATELSAQMPALKEGVPVAQTLAEVSLVGQEAVQVILSGRAADDNWVRARAPVLLRAGEAGAAAVELPLLAPLKLLVAGAAEQKKRTTLAADAWREYLCGIAFPPPGAHPE